MGGQHDYGSGSGSKNGHRRTGVCNGWIGEAWSAAANEWQNEHENR
jgi:hypothetical protein